MANSIDKLAKEIKKEILSSDERKPQPYDTQAEVVRVVNGTAWVHIPGGVEETPVKLTIDAKKGDTVNIHVEKGSAWITGNGTRPPTDDARANVATHIAEGAKNIANIANDTATEAQETAIDARAEAETAKTAADEAKTDAAIAKTAADSAVADASAANVAATEAKADAATAKTSADNAVRDAAAAHTAANSAVTGLGIVQGVVDSLSIDMDEMQTHVAMMNAVGNIPAGLHVVPTSNGYFVVLSNDGMYVYDSESTLVATFGENIIFNSTRPQKIGGDDVYIEYYDSDNDGEADSLRIVGANISSSTGIPTRVSELQNDSGYTTKTYVDDAVGDTATDLANYILSNDRAIEDLENQIDGAIDTWYYAVDPTTSNEPAVNWTTDALKESHLRDLYFNTSNGHTWRWAKEGNAYKWIQIEDADAIKALADAAKAQTTADTKRRVFVSQPTPPYDIGDLWVQGSSGDIYKCKTAKTSAQSYATGDWDKASKYTDDSSLNTFKTTTYATNLQQTNDAISLRATKTEAQGYANTAEYNAKTYTDTQISTAKAEIKVTTDNISSEVSQKVGNSEIISKINQSAETVKIEASKVEIDGTATFNAIKSQTDAAYDAKGAASTVQTNLEASAVAQEQRIYYRSKVLGTVPKPTAWVTNTADKYNDTVSVGNSGWSTKVTPIASSKGAGVTKYLYLYTCIQRKTVSGAVSFTDVLLDDSTTVIDGGNIVTGTVTANQIGANAITSDKIASNAVTVGKINPLVYEYNNAGQGTGYAKICTISITATYRNKPITFTIQGRNKNATSVSFRFQNLNNPSSAKVQSATYDGDIPLYYVGTSQTYNIYFLLGESYDNVRIYDLILPYSTGLEVTWAGEYYGTSLPTGAVEFTKLAGSRKSSDIDNAAKTATSYITHIDSAGIRIHPSSTENNAAVINASGMEIYKGGVSVAKYGDTARVGQEEKSHMLIADTSIEGISENGTKFFSISSNGGEGTSESTSRIAWDLDNTATSYNLSSVLGEKWTSLANGKEFSIYVEYYETKDNHIVRRWQAPLGTSFTKGQSRDTSIGINYTAPDTVIIKQYYPTLDDGYVFSHKDVYFSVEITQSNMPLYRFGTGVAEIGGNNSFLMGTGTVASYNNQLAIGEYNMDSMYALFMVGKGESERRKNVFEVGAWNNVEDGYVRINDKKVADFVVETGEVEVNPSGTVANYGTGNWEWREWYSGKVEMWYSGSITLNQTASNAGGLYRYIRRIPLPISPLYRLTCIVNGTAGGGWLNCGGLFNNSDVHQEPYTRIEIMAYQINARPAQEQTNVNIYACGNLYE